MIIPVLTDINAIEGNGSLGGIVEAAEQFNESSLSRSVGADYGQPLTTAQLNGYIFERIFSGARVSKTDMVEGKYIVVIVTLFRGQRTLVFGIGQIQEGKERVKVLGILPELP